MFQIITFKNKSHKQPRQLLQLNFNMHRQLFIIILYRKIQHSLIQQTLLYTKTLVYPTTKNHSKNIVSKNTSL